MNIACNGSWSSPSCKCDDDRQVQDSATHIAGSICPPMCISAVSVHAPLLYRRRARRRNPAALQMRRQAYGRRGHRSHARQSAPYCSDGLSMVCQCPAAAGNAQVCDLLLQQRPPISFQEACLAGRRSFRMIKCCRSFRSVTRTVLLSAYSARAVQSCMQCFSSYKAINEVPK